MQASDLCVVVDVDDLEVAERFWSTLTGIPVIESVFPGRYSYLGQADPWRHEVILHLVDEPKQAETNRAHVDIWVADVDHAHRDRGDRWPAQAGAQHLPPPGLLRRRAGADRLGGRPGPVRQRVLRHRVLAPEEARAVRDAALHGPADDRGWRRRPAGSTRAEPRATTTPHHGIPRKEHHHDTSVQSMPVEVAQGDLVTRYLELGEMAIRHCSLPAGTDMGPVLQGLPSDRCPSPHWGIVLKGSIRIDHADGTRRPPRRRGLPLAGRSHGVTDESVEFIEVGPVVEMRAFSEHARGLFA